MWKAIFVAALCLAGCGAPEDEQAASQPQIGTVEYALRGLQSCGGIYGLVCPANTICVDIPNVGCDPRTGGADCAGACVTPGPACGGFAGLACPTGMICVDVPGDGCNPKRGGADCAGICIGVAGGGDSTR
jgi:hypothetical protein